MHIHQGVYHRLLHIHDGRVWIEHKQPQKNRFEYIFDYKQSKHVPIFSHCSFEQVGG